MIKDAYDFMVCRFLVCSPSAVRLHVAHMAYAMHLTYYALEHGKKEWRGDDNGILYVLGQGFDR
jgi:hypothetical protein